jgi:small neutral amino acid transporter SnatA (MarC family)
VPCGTLLLIATPLCGIRKNSNNDKLVRTVENNVISVIGKIMGLIIAIIGTNMIIEGMKIAFSLT